jgi:hypothetical protein
VASFTFVVDEKYSGWLNMKNSAYQAFAGKSRKLNTEHLMNSRIPLSAVASLMIVSDMTDNDASADLSSNIFTVSRATSRLVDASATPARKKNY